MLSEKNFWKYVLPSMITVLLGGTFAFVDGVFIGQGTGDLGLTAVNLVAPIAALVTALAAGIGMGGSIVMSTYAGNKDRREAKKAQGSTITLLCFVSLLLFLIGSLFSKQIVSLLGAKDEVFSPAFDYLKIVLTFGCFQMFSSGLSNLVINSGKSILAMTVMVVALILNIILDALFVLVFQMGTFGAALATVMGQAVAAISFIIVLWKDKNTRPYLDHLKPNNNLLKKIIKTGVSPFGIQLAPSIVVMSINFACVFTNGTKTLAAFAVLNQVILAIQILFTGIGNGIQPIISYCTGANNKVAVRKTIIKAMKFMMGISGVLMFVLWMGSSGISVIFNASKEVANMVKQVMGYLVIMIPFVGFNRILVPYFFASSKNKQANLLTYLEPLIITPICLFICCMYMGAHGVWLAMVIAQVVLWGLGFVLFRNVK